MPISNAVDKLMHDLIWGFDNNRQSIHLIKLDTVSTPKFLGGLGVKRKHFMNQALLGKLSWQLLQPSATLLYRVLHNKYLHNVSLLAAPGYSYAEPSPTWRAILFGMTLLKRGIQYRINNGATPGFWTDMWTAAGPLERFASQQLTSTLRISRVQDFHTTNGWNTTTLSRLLPPILFNLSTIYVQTGQPVELTNKFGDIPQMALSLSNLPIFLCSLPLILGIGALFGNSHHRQNLKLFYG